MANTAIAAGSGIVLGGGSAVAGGLIKEAIALNTAAKDTSAVTPGPITQQAENCGGPGVCFTAGTLVAEVHSLVPIEDIHVGDRVLSADSKDQKSDTNVDPKTWEVVTLEMHLPGDIVRVQLLRSSEWLKCNRASPGTNVWLEWKAIDIAGWATVISVMPSPPVLKDVGRVVTATICHESNTIYKLILSYGGPIEITGVHLPDNSGFMLET